jgi:hypothetical protein
MSERAYLEQWRDEQNERAIREITGPPSRPPLEILYRKPPQPWRLRPVASDVSGVVIRLWSR